MRGVGAGRSAQRGTSGATTGPRGARSAPPNPDNVRARSAPPNPEADLARSVPLKMASRLTRRSVFRRLLIANRGEIAARVIRGCREMVISPIAVYSDVDALALHVRMADAAYPIGPAPASESYLRIDKILEAARRSGAEAVHPGYGFLAENAEFAQACIDAGLVFVGPPPKAMRHLGLKTEARKLMSAAGVPVVPGTPTPLKNNDEGRRAAEEVGFPVALKAVAGGGGKGLRLRSEERR